MNSIPFSDATGVILTSMVVYIIVFLCVTLLFWWLWNITVPHIFGLKAITPLEALRLLIIAAILFGGFPWLLLNVWR